MYETISPPGDRRWRSCIYVWNGSRLSIYVPISSVYRVLYMDGSVSEIPTPGSLCLRVRKYIYVSMWIPIYRYTHRTIGIDGGYVKWKTTAEVLESGGCQGAWAAEEARASASTEREKQSSSVCLFLSILNEFWKKERKKDIAGLGYTVLSVKYLGLLLFFFCFFLFSSSPSSFFAWVDLDWGVCTAIPQDRSKDCRYLWRPWPWSR